MAYLAPQTLSGPPAWLRYGVAVLSVAAALGIGRLLALYLQTDPFVSLFLCAVLLSSWFGGVGPGLLTTFLAVVAFEYYFIEPVGSLQMEFKEVPRLGLFAIVALVVALLTAGERRASGSLRQARDQLERAVRELGRLNEALQAENAERRRAEEEIRQTQRELQLTIDGIPVMAASYTRDGQLDFVNQTWRDYTGLLLDSGDRHRWGLAIHPDDLPMVEAAWRAHLATGEPFQLEQRMRRHDGEYRTYLISRVPLRDETGTVIKWYGAGYDIEDQKRALAELQQSRADLAKAERELSQMVDTIPVLVRRFEADGTPDYANRTSCEFSGIPIHRQSERALWVEVVHPDDREAAADSWRRHLQSGTAWEIECRLRRADGEYRRVVARRVPLRDESGKLVRWYGAAIDIEDQKRAMEALQRSEAELAMTQHELRQMIDTIPVLVRRFTADGTTDYVNRTTSAFTGRTPENWPTVAFRDSATHPEDLERVEREWRAHVRAGRPYETVYRLRRHDGVYRRIFACRVPLRDETGQIVRWYGAGYDVEEHLQALEALQRNEAELAKAERELRLIVDTIPVMVRRFNADGTPDFVNRTGWEFTGIPPEEQPSWRRWESADHPDDRQMLDAKWREHLRTGEPYDVEFRLRRADGEYRWIFSRRVPLRDENGKVIKWYSAAYDIEEQKRAMAALRRSEAELAKAERELRLIVDTIPAMVTTYRADGTLDFVNQTWRRYTAYAPEVYTHERWKLIIHPDDLPTVAGAWAVHLAAKTPFRTEQRVQRADGSYRWCLTSRVPLLDESGEVIRWYGASYDIDDQKQALAALQRSQAYLDEAQRLSLTGWIGWRVADGEITWSDAAYGILGIDRSVRPTTELILSLIHPDDRELVARQIERATRGEDEYDYEHRLLAPDGSIRHIRVRAHRMTHEWGEEEIVGAVMDVTAAREAETALQSAQAKLAHVTRVTTLGEMSASIAHEVNQPLAAIAADGAASMRWLQRGAPDVGEAMHALRRIVGEADRASRVIRRIRDLAKKVDIEMVPLDINGVVEEAATFVQREATSRRVALRLQLAPGLPRARGDRIQLQQVIINLVINGVQAMEQVTDHPRVLTIRTEAAERGGVLVAVQDAGVGVAPENMARLFGAFYTTKPSGMGMGLSICRSIVEAHGGRVWASPNAGPGMTFQFTVSASEGPALSSA
jgi:PAS domain S-box-containing protein